MRRFVLATALAAFTAGPAAAQDAPPPGCRWMGDGNLACKDGKGYWRRSGDEQIVGTYSVAKPKPKRAPVTASAPAAPPSTPSAPPAPVVAPAAAPEPLPPPSPPPAPAPVAAAPQAPSVQSAEVKAPRPWWRRWLDSVWRDIQALLRLFGVGR